MLEKNLELGQDFTPGVPGIPPVFQSFTSAQITLNSVFLNEKYFAKGFKSVKPKISYFKCPLFHLLHVVYVSI